MGKLRVGVLGATGAVGRQFLKLLRNHPWFEVVTVAASPRSAGRLLRDVLEGCQDLAFISQKVASLRLLSVADDSREIAEGVDLVFSATGVSAEQNRVIEEGFAALGVPVISNNSAHRWTEDVPVIIPEINSHHLTLIDWQRRRRGWSKGLIVAKPNCSIQTYVPVLTALAAYKPVAVRVVSLQAVSGAGRTLAAWPEMNDNIIPFIEGEEEKSAREPMKIWGELKSSTIELAKLPKIDATCVRVPVEDGHMACVEIELAEDPTEAELIDALTQFRNPIASLDLPSSPPSFLQYMKEADRPQTRRDRENGAGMSVSVGRLQKTERGWKFIALSHNTVRGAAGGAILTAELLVREGYIEHEIYSV